MGNFMSKRSDMISTVPNECDRISKLPNDVLCHILSFLETKHAVRASALSTRWNNLFTLVPVLSFHGSDQGGRTTHNQFIAFVYKVFSVYEITNMQSFILDYDFLIPSSSHIHSWVFNAISRNVRELCLKIDSDDMVSLPREICTSKTLVKLELTGNFTLNFGSYMCLPGLKTLRLYDVYISMEDGLKNLRFSIFPVLEHLVLQCFYDPAVRFDISISSLKTLQLLMQPKQVSNIIINAPALECLVFLGNRLTYMSGKMLASLVEAEFCFFSPFENCDGLRNLVKMCSNANNLLFDYSMEALIDYELPRFKKLTCLKLKIGSGWKLLPDLLKSSPNLEILIIDVGEHYLQLQENGEIEHLLALRDCACSSVHLKELKFQNFSGIKHEFKLVEYILKNAEVLNKVALLEEQQNEAAENEAEEKGEDEVKLNDANSDAIELTSKNEVLDDKPGINDVPMEENQDADEAPSTRQDLNKNLSFNLNSNDDDPESDTNVDED